MTHICNIIPIMHCNILFHFDEINFKMKIKLSNRKYEIGFRSIDELQIWRSTINDLADSRIDEKIEDEIVTNFLTNLDNNVNYSGNTFDNFINYLNHKITNTEDKLKSFIEKRDLILNFADEKKNLLDKPLEEIMNAEKFEDVQENYMRNRMKRISLNGLNKSKSTNMEEVNDIDLNKINLKKHNSMSK